MDDDAAAFVLDRIDLARMALLEAKQTVDKFDAPEDQEVDRLLEGLLVRAQELDNMVRGRSYQPSR